MTSKNLGISIEKLEALLRASEEMMRSVVGREPQTTFDVMTQHITKFLDIESCALFLVAPENPAEMVLKSSYTDQPGDQKSVPVRILIQSVPHGD